VKRVVLTSSFAAIGYGHPVRPAPFDETSWTDPGGADVLPYTTSKTLAERAAWDFVAREGGGLELATVNPVGVLGPVLGPEGAAARRVPSFEIPDWLVRLAALRDPAARQIVPELGRPKNATGAKAQRLLGWAPRSSEEAIVATAESLVRLGLTRDARRRKATA
jgi:nucleoside-diphosphate-sugar epimerase